MSRPSDALTKQRIPFRGASLIDVIAIIAILSLVGALVFPLITRSREQVRQETCYGNLRKLTQAVLLYAQDNDGYPVPASIDYGKRIEGVTWFATRAYWPHLLFSYVGSSEPYWCPSAPFERPPWGEGMEWKTYGINVHLSDRIPEGIKSRRPLSDVPYPDEVGLFADSSGVCLLSAKELITEPAKAPYLSPAFYTDAYITGARTAYPAHGGSVTIAYLDGHASAIPFHQLRGRPEIAARLWGEPFTR